MGCLEEPSCYLATILGPYVPCTIFMIYLLIKFEIYYKKNSMELTGASLYSRLTVWLTTTYQITTIIRSITFTLMNLKGSILMGIMFTIPAIIFGTAKGLSYNYTSIILQENYQKLGEDNDLINPLCCCCSLKNNLINNNNNKYKSKFTQTIFILVIIYIIIRINGSLSLIYPDNISTLSNFLALFTELSFLIFLIIYIWQRYNKLNKLNNNNINNDIDNTIYERIKQLTLNNGIRIIILFCLGIIAIPLASTSDGYNPNKPNNFGYWSVDYVGLIGNTSTVFFITRDYFNIFKKN